MDDTPAGAAGPAAGAVRLDLPSLDALTAGPDARLYLRPLAVPVADGARPAARIGGGWAGFDTAEVVIRDGDRVARAAAPLDALRGWAADRGRAVAGRLEELLESICAARPPFAGVHVTRPVLMGVLNVTPDSFSDGGDFAEAAAAVARGKALGAAGAAFLDIGGESTRPGSDPVAAAEETRRVLPVISALAAESGGAVISIDTRKAPVMDAALGAGARVINDISALDHDPASLPLAARAGVPVVLMHCRGEPKTMQQAPAYAHPPTDIFDYLAQRIEACVAAGIARDHIAVDPGIGFGKSLDHNLAILADLALLHGLGCPLLIGVSRKSFIGHITGEAAPKRRLPGSLAAALWGVSQGAQILRVHDVAEARQALAVWQAIAAP